MDRNVKKLLINSFFVICSGFLMMSSCSKDKTVMEEKMITEENDSYKSISMSEAIELMAESIDYILLDVRRPDEFSSGHIPGAILFTNELITKDDAEKLLPNKEQTIFVYCRSGRRSKEASQKLFDYGYTNVIEIGGILDYNGNLEK